MKLLYFLVITVWIFIDKSSSAESVQYVEMEIDSPLADIQWVTKTVVYLLSESGVLYRSEDGGRNWRTDSSRYMAGAEIQSIDISPVDPKYIFFRSQENSWFTTDMGHTYKRQKMDFSDVRLHLSKEEWIIASRNSKGCGLMGIVQDCFKTLWYSKDFGVTWKHCLDYVVQFDWAAKHHGEPDLVYATVHENKVGSQKFGYWDKNIHFVSTIDYFETQTVLVEHGNRFLFGTSPEGTHDLQMFVAAVNPRDETQVKLMIAKSEGAHTQFHEAMLPVDLTEHSYTILETSEGTVFLHVNHKPLSEAAETGHLYVSDWSGLKYTLSLPYNRRNKAGKCDFEKIEGLEGIYIANFVDTEDAYVDEERDTIGIADDKVNGGVSTDKKVTPKKLKKTKTVISFDKGGEWNYLAAPTRDIHDQPLKCNGKCHLHLHGITGEHGPFYSSKYALGLIMATGSLGEYLGEGDDENVNAYISRDAGLTWREVAQGSHIYEFGDHGGLIVMADDTKPTKNIMYSWNEGLVWSKLQITENFIYVDNIIIEPSSTAVEFIVYGWKDGPDGKGVAIHIDFSPLHERFCEGADTPDSSTSDYEIWTPSDGRLGGKCLLGHTVHYVRRKADHACFNPVEFERPKGYQHCACTREDFECDYGYEIGEIPEEGGDEKCQKMAFTPRHDDITKDAGANKDCSGGATRYTLSQGYRRVPGDTCEGGTNWDPLILPCDFATSTASSVGKIILIILVMVAVTLAIVTCCNKYNFFDKWHWKERFASFKYKAVGPDNEEAFYFNEADFNQSAHLIHEDDDEHELNELDDETNSFRPLPKASNNQNQFIPTLMPPPNSH